MEPDTYVIICGSLACWPIQTLRPFCAEQCLEHLGNCCRAPPRGSACKWSEITKNSEHSLWLAMCFFLSSHGPTATKQRWQSKLGSAQAWHSSAAASLRDIYKSWEAASQLLDEEETFPHASCSGHYEQGHMSHCSNTAWWSSVGSSVRLATIKKVSWLAWGNKSASLLRKQRTWIDKQSSRFWVTKGSFRESWMERPEFTSKKMNRGWLIHSLYKGALKVTHTHTQKKDKFITHWVSGGVWSNNNNK